MTLSCSNLDKEKLLFIGVYRIGTSFWELSINEETVKVKVFRRSIL